MVKENLPSVLMNLQVTPNMDSEDMKEQPMDSEDFLSDLLTPEQSQCLKLSQGYIPPTTAEVNMYFDYLFP